MEPECGCTVARGVRIERGEAADYRWFERFHYRGGRPRGVARVFVAWCGGGECDGMPAGIVVETMPPLNAAARERALGWRYAGQGRRERAVALNGEVRTIARVVVHPRVRGIGIGVRLVRRVLETAATPYVEAFAAMGRVHPLFERAGMVRVAAPRWPAGERVRDALAACGLRPVDLVDLRAETAGEAVRAALKAFARDKRGTAAQWLAEARQRLLSAPAYYLWCAAGEGGRTM